MPLPCERLASVEATRSSSNLVIYDRKPAADVLRSVALLPHRPMILTISPMDRRRLVDLPPPSPEKARWPWTQSDVRPAPPPESFAWPRVTVVTPSFNQGAFIEETIRSVLLQDYPNLEYFIVDGGSTDSTLEVIKTYEPWIDYWVSERDRGQTHAINKGFARATGEILAWLNSDDTFEPHAIRTVVQHMMATNGVVTYGNCNLIDETGARTGVVVPPPVSLESLLKFWSVDGWASPPQPASFFRRSVLDEVGFLDETLHYAMDYDLWIRIARRYSFSYVGAAVIGNCRMHSESKTVSQLGRTISQRYSVSLRYGRSHGLRYRVPYWKSYAHYRFRVWRSRLWSVIRRYPLLKPVEHLALKLCRR